MLRGDVEGATWRLAGTGSRFREALAGDSRPFSSPGRGRMSAADRQLLDRLRAGDEATFMQLVDRYGGAMRSVALRYVSSRAAADDVVQDAWLAVITSLDRFEGRSSLKTWIMSILKHTAYNRARKEGRAI